MVNQIAQSPALKTIHPSQPETTDDYPPNEVLKAVQEFMTAFAKAIKSYALYPETHTISENLLSGLENSLTNFFQISTDLKLDIEKDRICYEGVDVYRRDDSEDSLITPFFRDGIIWIEFREGTTAAELAFLLDILSEYRILTDESEGDLVTALWKKNLPHIYYEATDISWEKQPKLDFSHFRVPEASKEKPQDLYGLKPDGADVKQQDGSGGDGNQSTVSILSQEVKRYLMPLTPDENKKLEKLIIEEEQRNRSEDILDMLLIILGDGSDEEEFGNILELLVQEFENSLRHGELQLAVKILVHLNKLADREPAKQAWRGPLIDRYIDSVSDPEFLMSLKTNISKLNSEDAAQLKIFRQILLMLRPKAVLALGPLMSEVSSTALRRRIMEAIAILSKKDSNPLSQLLQSPDDLMVRQLVTIIGHLDGKEPQKLLLNMTRHFSPGVRMGALKQLLKRNACVQRSYFFLIEDASEVIRSTVLSRLASDRKRASEDPLLEYLQQKIFAFSSYEHILSCYTVLGKCGSSRSIPFLKATLEERAWWEILSIGGSPHRWGAALALAELKLTEADKILQRAARSFFPPTKRAARNAIAGRRPQ